MQKIYHNFTALFVSLLGVTILFTFVLLIIATFLAIIGLLLGVAPVYDLLGIPYVP